MSYRPARSRSLRAVLATSLALASCLFASTGVYGAPPTVVINEVHYHPGDDSRIGEFVELYNYGSEAVDVGDWILFGGVQYVIQRPRTIQAGEFLVIAADPNSLITRYGLDPDKVLGPYDASLSNEGEQVSLFTAGSYKASFVDYDDSSPWPETPDGLGPSLERTSHMFEESDAWTWAASIAVGGTPGAPNSVRVGAGTPPPPPPGTEDVDYILTAAEWSYLPGTEEPPGNWNTRSFNDGGWNTGDVAIGYEAGGGPANLATTLDDMEGSYLTVYLRRDFTVADASRVRELRLSIDYDDGFIAYINGVEIARSGVNDESFDSPAEFAHEAGVPELFTVTPPDGVLQNGQNVLAVQAHNFSLGSSDFSVHPSLAGSIGEAGEDPDPPESEGLERPARDLVINEISTGGNGTGWVELYNPTDSDVDASGRHLQLYPASVGHFTLPNGSNVPAGGFISFTESQLGFELDGIQAIILSTDDRRFIDAMNPRTTAANESTGRFPDGDDNRVVMITTTRDDDNEFSVTTPVVINEIMYHPGNINFSGEWIELHNRTNSEVDISGWSFTRGISVTFPNGTTIAGNGFLVIARNPTGVEEHYGISDVLGPFGGGLDNAAETLILRDERRNVRDRVRYADEGSFPESPDGEGPSLELTHPDIDNRYGPAWRASDTETAPDGTPGAENSRISAIPLPIVAGVKHSPVIPSSSDDVLVTALVSDDLPLDRVRLFWEVDESGNGDGSREMFDDGINDDGIAGNNIYGATIPPRSDGSIVAFWIEAEGNGDPVVVSPQGAPRPAYLYRVENSTTPDLRPRYRFVMRASDLTSLRTRGVGSNVLLDVTVVADGKAYYNRGIRYRGNSARRCDPLSYRVQFDHDSSLHGIKRLNMNGCNAWRQWTGLDFLRRVNMPTPRTWFRRLNFNGTDDTQWHLRVEAIDRLFLERTHPGDDDGNLYRGIGQANLDYRGEDFGPYRNNYEKHSNEEEDDYSDVVEISFRFDSATTSDEDFPEAIEERVDVRQWAFYFAAFAMLGSTENSIVLNNGDDYFLYHRFSDNRWELLPWDLDSCYDEANQVLFRPTVDAIERFLQHPRYAPDYLCSLQTFLAEAWVNENMQARIDHLVPLFSANQVQVLRDFVPARIQYVEERLNQTFEVSSAAGAVLCSDTIFPQSDTVTLIGRAPGCGTVDVVVNGDPASFDYRAGTWSASINVEGVDKIAIVTLDRNGLQSARMEFTVGEIVETPTGDVHVQGAGEPGVAAFAARPFRVDDPNEDGQNWETAGGVDSSINPDNEILQAPSQGFPRQLEQSHAAYLFRFLEAGQYRLYLRARGFSGASNTVWIPNGFDTDPDLQLGISRNGNWNWTNQGNYNVSQADVDRGRVFEFRLGVRELDAQVDAIIFHQTTGLGPQQLTSYAIENATGTTSAVPRAHVAVDPGTDLTIFGESTEALLDATESNDGACGDDPVSFLWEKVVGPAEGDEFLSPVDGAVMRIRFSGDGGNFIYRLTVTNDRTGARATEEIEFTVTPSVDNAFLRCDANSDARIEVSDAVFTLLFLFAGGSSPSCAEALDCNSDGGVTLGDAVFQLNYLLRGGTRPDAPFPACDAAPQAECAQTTCVQ